MTKVQLKNELPFYTVTTACGLSLEAPTGTGMRLNAIGNLSSTLTKKANKIIYDVFFSKEVQEFEFKNHERLTTGYINQSKIYSYREFVISEYNKGLPINTPVPPAEKKRAPKHFYK